MSEKYTLSFCAGDGNLNHNNRKFIAQNVNGDLVQLDVALIKKDLKDTYQELFGEALKEYNQKQTRKDRIIKDYLEHIRRSKNNEKIYEEVIIMVGNKDHHPNNKTAEKILREALLAFQRKNKNCIVFNAVIHFDEATPHLHLDYVNIKTQTRKGLRIQVSKKGAMKEMGYGSKKDEYDRWIDDNRKNLLPIMHENGIEIVDGECSGQMKIDINLLRKVMSINAREIRELPNINYSEEKGLFGTPTGNLIVSKSDYEIMDKKAKLAAMIVKNIDTREAGLKSKILALETKNQKLEQEKTSSQNEASIWKEKCDKLATKYTRLTAATKKLLKVIIDETLDLSPKVADALKPFSKFVDKYIQNRNNFYHQEQEIITQKVLKNHEHERHEEEHNKRENTPILTISPVTNKEKDNILERER